jgi:hypothetical protein
MTEVNTSPLTLIPPGRGTGWAHRDVIHDGTCDGGCGELTDGVGPV